MMGHVRVMIRLWALLVLGLVMAWGCTSGGGDDDDDSSDGDGAPSAACAAACDKLTSCDTEYAENCAEECAEMESYLRPELMDAMGACIADTPCATLRAIQGAAGSGIEPVNGDTAQRTGFPV